MWPWKIKHVPHASPEAELALARGQTQLAQVRELREQAGLVKKAADSSLAHNHFGAAVTAAMGGPIRHD